MPYTPEHKQKTRDSIVASARNLFIEKGYTEVSIDEIMADAGLTRGGFYNHFKNKEDLFKAAIDSFMACDYFETLGAPPFDKSFCATALANHFVTAYLSKHHMRGGNGVCPLIALPTDVARAAPAIKASYQKLFEGMLGIFERAVKPGTDQEMQERALTLAATCVGGMVLARALGDNALSDRIRAAALSAAHQTLDGHFEQSNGQAANDQQDKAIDGPLTKANGSAAASKLDTSKPTNGKSATIAAE